MCVCWIFFIVCWTRIWLTNLFDSFSLTRPAEAVLNNFLSEGDELIKQIKKELNETPFIAKRQMYALFSEVNTDWNSFRSNCKNDPGQLIGGPSVRVDMPSTSGADFASNNRFDRNMQLAKGITILEKTSQSLHRASQAARESEGANLQFLFFGLPLWFFAN